MMHPNTELKFINETIGYGVVATEFIPKGTITWILDDLDLKLDPCYVDSLDDLRKKQVIKYSYRDPIGQYILCWDLARFVNHSFHANCIPTPYDCEIASRDIYPGEELTDDYGWLNLDEPFECLRDVQGNRTKVMPDDILNYYQQWDQLAADAMQYFNQVKQPLKHLLHPKYEDKIRAVIEGKEKMESLKTYCYYERSQES
jgi:hypothetical protein